MIFIFIAISILYLFLIIAFIIGSDKVEKIQNKNVVPKNSFSIVIAFRNEAKNLPLLLKSISELNYPTNLFEIILVNDDSSDNFQPIFENLKKQYPKINLLLINTISATSSPKKDAITYGIKNSTFDWIVTTDADCEVPLNWLQLFNQLIEEKQVLFVSAPVKFKNQKSFLFHFQNLNFSSLIGSTIGGFGIKKPFMCNGANLCYSKNIFNELNGFSGNEKIASGDDIFLMEKMLEKYPEKTLFLKSEEAIVLTNSEENWNKFFNQQIRWASKSTSYNNSFAKLVGLMVLLENIVIVILFLIALFNPFYWKVLLYIFIQKMIIDFILLLKTTQLFKNYNSIGYFPVISLLYPFFILFIGFLSLFKKYDWKGRKFSK